MKTEVKVFLLLIVIVEFAQSFRFIASSRLKHQRLSSFSIDIKDPYKAELAIPTSIMPSNFTGTGCVLLAQPGEHDHHLHNAPVLVFSHDSKKGSAGVILDRPSAFTVGEASPGIGEAFFPNTLFMGGGQGTDSAIMLHAMDYGGLARKLGYGIYLGGMGKAREYVEEGKANSKDFKFIFNYVEWAPGLLEQEILSGRWDVCVVPPKEVLSQDTIYRKQNLWSKARNALRIAGALRSMPKKGDFDDADDDISDMVEDPDDIDMDHILM